MRIEANGIFAFDQNRICDRTTRTAHTQLVNRMLLRYSSPAPPLPPKSLFGVVCRWCPRSHHVICVILPDGVKPLTNLSAIAIVHKH